MEIDVMGGGKASNARCRDEQQEARLVVFHDGSYCSIFVIVAEVGPDYSASTVIEPC
jgi:hypothetical protein